MLPAKAAPAAEDERHIGISATDNGMAELYGTVAAGAATAFDRRLSQLAKQVCPADPRTLDQRRADALAALTQSRDVACAWGQPRCPTRAADTATAQRGPGGAQVVINVVASDHTVHGDSPPPGYLQGYGVIDAEQVRELAATAALHVIDPFTSPVDALRYQPSAGLERVVRCRDLTCRFPGCSRQAVYCDVDHTIPFNHQDPGAGGLTVFENLKCLCRLHHRLKTFGGWRDTQLADGTVVWTSPTGRKYRTSPAGADLFPQVSKPACARPAPNGEVGQSSAAPELLRRAGTIGNSDPSTNTGAGWSRPENRRSTREHSEITCATCCFYSRARQVPAPTAPG